MRAVTKGLFSFCLAALCAGALSPAALAAPQVSLSRGAMSFADLCIGGTAGPLCFTITNTGGGPLVINSIRITHCSSSIDPTYIDCTKVAGFQISSGGAPGSLAPGQVRTVCITFSPQQPATFDSHVVITTNAAGPPIDVPLHGTGDP